jgi:hypothetical protein
VQYRFTKRAFTVLSDIEGALEGPDARGARDPVGARGASSSLLPTLLSKRSSSS